MVNFTIGCDVEIFGKDSSGKHRALCGLIGGTKEQPLPMSDELSPEFAVQEDNVSVEFNIPPSNNIGDFTYFVYLARKELEKKLSNLGLTFSDDCAVSFDKSELVHPNALVFGCEPDYDAWKLVENSKPQATDPTLRTAGGHIHVGCDSVDMVKGVQNMDLFLGIPSVILDSSPSSVKRRELYGKAGAMRPKPYGWEYRSLSNFWIFEDQLVDWVYKATKSSLEFNHKFTKKEAKIIQDCINTGDAHTAEGLIKHYNLVMP